MQDYDKSSKWLIQHHGDAILRLGGVDDIVSWRALQAEVVQPRQLPDGLLEVTRRGKAKPELFIVEIATYPETRVMEQIVRNAALVYLQRRELPECLVLVLHLKGTSRDLDSANLRSPAGWTEWSIRWRCVKLWEVPAEELLNTTDVGVGPWIPLTHFEGPPEPIVRRCVERIKKEAVADERENLLAVIQVLYRLRYNDPNLLRLLGGPKAMIESPVIQEMLAEYAAKKIQESIVLFLSGRFGKVTKTVTAQLKRIDDLETLRELVTFSSICPDLKSFRARLLELESDEG